MDDHLVELTLTGVLAYGTYLLADSLGQSGIIATVTAGIVLRQLRPSGRHQPGINPGGRHSVGVRRVCVDGPRVPAHWSHDLARRSGRRSRSDRVGVVAIFVGRIVVVYGLLGGVRGLARRLPPRGSTRSEWSHIRRMPMRWLHVVFWSGLRGAVAFAWRSRCRSTSGSGAAPTDDLRRRPVHAACSGGVGPTRRAVGRIGARPAGGF